MYNKNKGKEGIKADLGIKVTQSRVRKKEEIKKGKWR